MGEPVCSKFTGITANVSGVRIFRNFTIHIFLRGSFMIHFRFF